VYRTINSKKYNFPIYVIAYGVWRFVIEYARADYRGNTFVSFLTPSQLVAVVLMIAGLVLAFIEFKTTRNTPSAEVSADE
jgi:prolipoprotein diacylglyceryltransferase